MPRKRREWLKKITKWFFEAPTDGEAKKTFKNEEIDRETNSRFEVKKTVQVENLEKRSLTPVAKACSIFLDSWEKEHLSRDLFVDNTQLEETLRSLDRDFCDELIDWLYRICTEPSVLKDLASIIERGRVSSADNIQAIRAYSYLSVLINTKENVNDNDGIKELVDETGSLDSKEVNEDNEPEENTIESQLIDEDVIAYEFKDQPLKELGLGIRTYNNLRRIGKENISDLAGMEENDFLSIRNFGPNTYIDLQNRLSEIGLELPISNNLFKYSNQQNKLKEKELEENQLKIN